MSAPTKDLAFAGVTRPEAGVGQVLREVAAGSTNPRCCSPTRSSRSWCTRWPLAAGTAGDTVSSVTEGNGDE
ncbi:hypothetical protein LX88_004093 [Lentzea californiensis]|nr:hypothetical protein [Lentzea californiensis]